MTHEKRWNRLYKGKYILAFYNRRDELVAVFNNPYDMAVSLGITIGSARSTVTHMKSGRLRCVRICGQLCKLYLIEYKENGE